MFWICCLLCCLCFGLAFINILPVCEKSKFNKQWVTKKAYTSSAMYLCTADTLGTTLDFYFHFESLFLLSIPAACKLTNWSFLARTCPGCKDLIAGKNVCSGIMWDLISSDISRNASQRCFDNPPAIRYTVDVYLLFVLFIFSRLKTWEHRVCSLLISALSLSHSHSLLSLFCSFTVTPGFFSLLKGLAQIPRQRDEKRE